MSAETSLELHDESERIIANKVRDNYALDLIFNRHANGADALRSIDEVRDNSIVFIEGAQFGSLAMPLAKTLKELFAVELIYGRDSEVYSNKKQSILEHSKSQKYQPALRENDFSQHTFTQIETLLEKDCTVLFADYSVDYAAEMPIAGIELGNEIELTPEFVARVGLAKSYVATKNALLDETIAQYRRETHAAVQMYKYLALQAMRDPDNKDDRDVVAIYGSAHTESLVENIDSTNLVAISSLIQLDYIEPHQYIPTPDSLNKTLPGRIALTALHSVVQFEESIGKNKALRDEVWQSEHAAQLHTILALQLLQSVGKYRETGSETDLSRAIGLATTLAPNYEYAHVTTL